MPIELNDNVKILAGKPAEPKSFYTDNRAYANTAQVLATIPVAQRHEYLPVNVAGVQYWFLPDLVTLVKVPANIMINDASVNNAIAVFDGTTGKLIKVTNSTIDEKGQLKLNSTPDENGFSVGLESYGNGSQGYGMVGYSPNIPIQATNTDTSPDGSKRCFVLTNDTGHTFLPQIGFGLYLQWRFPDERGNKDLSLISAEDHVLYSDVTVNAECSERRWYLLRNGVLTLQAVIDSKSQFHIDSLKLNPLAAAPANPTGGEMYCNTNGHIYKFNPSTLVWDDMGTGIATPTTLTSNDGSVTINNYDLSVKRAELELFADNETELLAAWAIAIASSKAARIYITNNITFTANRQFIQAYGSPAIKLECITQRYFIAGSYVIDFNNVVFTNITFRTTGSYYFRLIGGIGTFNNCGWVDDAIDTGSRKINILVSGSITMGTAKIILKTPTHFTQSSASNTTDLIQPFWIQNESAWSGAASERLYIELLEMSAVFEAARFARVLLTSSAANCPYSVTGDESWFYSPDQALPGGSNIKSTANILRMTMVDKLNASRLAANESAPYAMGINSNGDAVKMTRVKIYSGLLNQTGSASPTISLFSDDLGGPVWARTAVGTYTLTKVGAFPSGKTIPITDIYTDQSGNLFKINRTSANVMTLFTYAAVNTDVLSDSILVDRFINIEIYP